MIMSISASDVVKLRSQTGAGMMDCKNALEEAGGDMEKAADLLRKKGIVKAAKREGKVAAEGTVVSYLSENGQVGVLVEVNCETDFVAKSDDFLAFCKAVAEAIAKHNPADVAALTGVAGLAERIQELTLKIGEKVSIRRFTRYESATGKVYSYLHGTRIGVLLEMLGGDKELGADVAMHIAAANPKCIDRAGVEASEIAREKEIYAEQLRQQNKPANIIENIVKGKLDKYYSEVCLLEQPYIKEEEIKIEKLLSGKGASLSRFVRYELGEGIAKVEKDFASEVAEQLK